MFMKLNISGYQNVMVCKLITNVCFRSRCVSKENIDIALGLKLMSLMERNQRITKISKDAKMIVVR